ncbi:MAG: ankyrin repeat domain-containing protein [Gemmatimonadetes bacterium]|nr:ankyrin repeat domain-containing protein [Gemmatimonadota bacterium]
MEFVPVAWDAPIDAYRQQAESLLAGFQAAVPEVLDAVHRTHPRFLDEVVTWKPRDLTREEVASSPFDLEDARLATARAYSFLDWPSLVEHVTAVADPTSCTHRFEDAVQAVIGGELERLTALLDREPSLVRARSCRRTCHDPSVHEATLLHYVAANGVEGVNQRTPPNAPAIASLLLERGADPNATAGLYGDRCGVMAMLVSSAHPAGAGVHVALVDTLVAHGASVEPVGGRTWGSPLRTALVFGYREVAEALVRHGAQVQGLDVAAALGQTDVVRRDLSVSTPDERHRALAFAAQLGHAEVVDLLLEAGEDPNRLNPDGMHAHATPLHHGALAGHREVVSVLMRHGARLDIRDTLWQGTPLGWAEHAAQADVAELLRTHGART